MAKYIIDDSTLKGLANALRKVTGEDRTYTPTEMIETITTIMDSVTYILVDEEGNEISAVYVDSEVVLDATDNDVRKGATYVSDTGVSTGTKVIPSYNTHQGYRIIMPGSKFAHSGEHYDYTKMQAIICSFNTKVSDSVSAEKVSLNNFVYNVNSIDSISTVTINTTNENIDFGISNDTDAMKVLWYFYYKEIY